MCGIIGIASAKPVAGNIIEVLKKLEYRGYDSAGLSTIDNSEINEKKCSGRVDNLENILFKNPSKGNLGIGHVRWATHGVPNKINAHPHSSEEVSVVHNGIIENSNELKKDLEKKGYKSHLFIKHPTIEGKKIPLFIANIVLMEYGLGAIFGCPAHDQRDLDFAIADDLEVVEGGEGWPNEGGPAA